MFSFISCSTERSANSAALQVEGREGGEGRGEGGGEGRGGEGRGGACQTLQGVL